MANIQEKVAFRCSPEVKAILEDESRELGITMSALCAYVMGQHAKKLRVEKDSLKMGLEMGAELLRVEGGKLLADKLPE